MHGIRPMNIERRKHMRQNLYLPFEFRIIRPGGDREKTGRGITINVGRKGALLLMPSDDVEPGRMMSLSILMDQFHAMLAKAGLDGKDPMPCAGAGNVRMEVTARVNRLQKLSGMRTFGENRSGVAVEFDIPREEFDPAVKGAEDARRRPTCQRMEVQR